MRAWIPLCLLVGACGGETKVSAEDRMRQDIEFIRDQQSRLNNRVEMLEKSNIYANEVRAKEGAESRQAEADRARLESLGAGQNSIERNTKMMCDATGEC